MIIAFVAFFINGTDYFIGGMVGIVSGPVLYYIWRRMYGGLTKKDPVRYPGNPKTGLAVGDTKRMSIMFGILTVFGVIGSFFLPWFEGEWGDEWYLEVYGFEGFLGTMLLWIRIATIAAGVITVILAIVASKVEPKNKVTKA